jgi:hypothetical protein
MAMLKASNVYCFPSQRANHYSALITVLSAFVRWLRVFNDIGRHTFDGSGGSYFLQLEKNNMVEKRNCQS